MFAADLSAATGCDGPSGGAHRADSRIERLASGETSDWDGRLAAVVLDDELFGDPHVNLIALRGINDTTGHARGIHA